jgi:poly-gamma-glutamate synthesis protein (capsule biosynthesis protein)
MINGHKGGELMGEPWKRGSIAGGVAVLFIAGFLNIGSIKNFTGIFKANGNLTQRLQNNAKPAVAAMYDENTISNRQDKGQLNPVSNSTVTIAAVGDVMMHDGQIWSGYDSETGLYNYSMFFQDVKDEISSADIAMANLETTLGGKELKFTGYPKFNSPDELADALKDAGFDIIMTSNNHCLDRGEKGVVRTIDVLEQRRLMAVGTSRTAGERDRIVIKEINGVKIAFLAYTYGTNGNPVPKDKPYLVNLIEEDTILKDLTKARQSADAVVVYLHFGQEYQRVASEQQKKLAKMLLEKGADVVIGSHPHVTQPGEWVRVIGPGGEMVERYAAYSLGNFISAQRFPYTDEGVILKITIEKDLQQNRINVKDVDQIPTWVDKFKEDGKMRYVIRLGEKTASQKN